MQCESFVPACFQVYIQKMSVVKTQVIVAEILVIVKNCQDKSIDGVLMKIQEELLVLDNAVTVLSSIDWN